MSLQEANDPRTSAARLIELSKSPEETIAFAVAKNPSTPLKVILALVSSYPSAFLENPAIPLLLLENPHFLHEINGPQVDILLRAARELLFVKELPSWVVESLASHPDEEVCALVGGHPMTPTSLLASLAQDPSPLVRGSVAKNPRTPPDCFLALAHDKNSDVRYYLSTNPSVPAELLLLLSKDPTPDVRHGVATHRKTPLDCLHLLANDPEPVVHREAQKRLPR